MGLRSIYWQPLHTINLHPFAQVILIPQSQFCEKIIAAKSLLFFSSQYEGWDFNVFTDLEPPTEFHFACCTIWASALTNLACFLFRMSSCSSLSTWGNGNFCAISVSEFVWQGLKGIFEQIQYLNYDIWQGTHLYLSCSGSYFMPVTA